MKNNYLTILVTALVAGVLTFIATSSYFGRQGIAAKPDAGNNKSLVGSFNPSPFAHPYPLDSARMDIDTFQQLVTLLWGKNGGNVVQNGEREGIVGYTISAGDLVSALGLKVVNGVNGNYIMPTYPYVRVYLGFNVPSQSFKLFVVPVDTSAATGMSSCCGKDLFFNSDTESNNTAVWVNRQIPLGSGGNYVLDLIAPCPITCDTTSRLVLDSLTQTRVSCAGCSGSEIKRH